MATTPTNNPIPSESPRDLKYNAGKMDEIVNSPEEAYQDRFGKARLTWAGVEAITRQSLANFGYVTVESFEDGATLTSPNQVLRYESNGEYYRWDGEFDKVVPAGSTPASSGGVGAGAWLSVGDAALRTQLSSSAGADIIGYGSSTVADTLDEQQAEINSFRNDSDLIVDDFMVAGETTIDNAFQLALTQAKTTGRPIRFLAKNYTFAQPSEWLMAQRGIKIYGAGSGRSVINFPNAQAGVTQLYIHSAADWYDFRLEGLSFTSSHSGTLCRITSPDVSDPLNVGLFIDLAFLNGFQSLNANALDLGYVVNSNFINVRANCYATGTGSNDGRALILRQLQFCAFLSCSFGNASYGIAIMKEANGSRGYTNGNVWNAVDVENVNYGIYCESPNAKLNTFIGGQYSLWTQYMIQAPQGEGSNIVIEIINGNYSQPTDSYANIVDPNNGSGVRITGVRNNVTQPNMPGSGSAFRNVTGQTISVYIWGGSVSSVNVNGFGIGMTSGMFIIKPWDTIAINYSSAPQWYWRQAE